MWAATFIAVKSGFRALQWKCRRPPWLQSHRKWTTKTFTHSEAPAHARPKVKTHWFGEKTLQVSSLFLQILCAQTFKNASIVEHKRTLMERLRMQVDWTRSFWMNKTNRCSPYSACRTSLVAALLYSAALELSAQLRPWDSFRGSDTVQAAGRRRRTLVLSLFPPGGLNSPGQTGKRHLR